MNLKKIFIDTIKDVVEAFVRELEKMFKAAIEKISVDPDCIGFYADIKKVFDEHPKDEKGRDLMDILLEDYKKKVLPQNLQPIIQKRNERLNGKTPDKKIPSKAAGVLGISSLPGNKIPSKAAGILGVSSLPTIKKGGATDDSQEKMDKHRIIVEPDILSQIKVPNVQLFEKDSYSSTINSIATPIKVGVKTVTCAACGVRNIYVTVRKKILDIFEGNTNAILDTLFDIESPVFAMVKGHVYEILDKLEKPIMENFAAIMFDVQSGQLSVKAGDISAEKNIAENLKKEDKKREDEEEKKRISLQADIDKRVADAKSKQREKDKADAAKKRQCGGGRYHPRRRRRHGGKRRTYKWRHNLHRVGAVAAKKTLRIK